MPALIALTQVPVAAPQSASEAHAAEMRMDLREREGKLSTEVARMDAQRPVIVKQIRDAGDSPFAMAHQQTLAQLDVQLAGARAELDAVREQLARIGTPAPQEFTTQAPPHFEDPGLLAKIEPNAVTAVFVLLAVGIIVPLSLGLARRLTRRPPPPPSVVPDTIIARLDRVDQALDAIAIEVERVAESQRFMAKMMAENAVKPVDAAAPGLDEAKPRLALGAGPIEPIRVNERQAVKQSITPH
jgi:hypothetical protein